MQSDTKEGATTVLTETDMVAGLSATSGRKCVLVSRDHPSISGFMGVDGRGILLHSHGWVREDDIRVRPPRRLFPATPKKNAFQVVVFCFLLPGERVRSALPKHMLGKAAAAAPVSSPRPIALRRNQPVLSARASVSLACRR